MRAWSTFWWQGTRGAIVRWAGDTVPTQAGAAAGYVWRRVWRRVWWGNADAVTGSKACGLTKCARPVAATAAPMIRAAIMVLSDQLKR